MHQLTKAEEQVMQILWKLEAAFVKDIVAEFPDPKPAYNTISTIIRILEKKEIVGFKAYGRTHQYFPILQKEEYLRYSTDNLLEKYFQGSVERLVSFFAREKNLSIEELEKIMNEINKDK